MALEFEQHSFLKELGIERDNFGCFSGEWKGSGEEILSYNPATNKLIAKVRATSEEDYEWCVKRSLDCRKLWSSLPMPERGEIVRQIGEALREKKLLLGKLISLEMGKILAEGIGEVQEFIDICDFGVGLSRQLSGKCLPSERQDHVMFEMWHPLGIVGYITAFNFPCAVFGWNSAISLVCGNVQIWKPSETTPLVAIALTKIIAQILKRNGYPAEIASLVIGRGAIGEKLAKDVRVPLISFTGSTKTGRQVSKLVHERLGKTILELGGNNAVIVDKDCNLDMALRAVLFGAVGTAGQRCTSTRRLYLHRSIYSNFLEKLVGYYRQVAIGDPLDEKTLMGPLHTKMAVEMYQKGIEEAISQGGKVVYGGKVIRDNFVEPTIIEVTPQTKCVQAELFAPILYVMPFDTLQEAITFNNSVSQGLSSSLFSNHISHVFEWLGPCGSDCGIVNVNIGTSGAEIGGAFGGEKETGGGRESGSDAWKQYMRRVTATVNYGNALPLAQGIQFGTS
ncbi:hypothetical protein GpartN1_g6763.t1 [Galdieria partita]|uniref:aldehyde dehydrogenase (NAD(+)) n=1 Tax=Galdieria partita TaxID=83374 RepID=A0A9C7Q3L5_9RHOD|nr:hypothetical protein GpartN1_g6763.t1 [Galdieria partita]